jgi:hypothetical protein
MGSCAIIFCWLILFRAIEFVAILLKVRRKELIHKCSFLLWAFDEVFQTGKRRKKSQLKGWISKKLGAGRKA